METQAKTYVHHASIGEEQAQKRYQSENTAHKFYNKQMRQSLNTAMRDFLSKQSMLFISTADAQGECDSSFRHGEAGFIRIIDDKTIAYPEYIGNGVMASLGNIIENPHIGLLCLDFFDTAIGLHINGRAEIIENDVFFTQQKMDAKAQRWVCIHIEEAYVHCTKHVPLLKPLGSAEAQAIREQRLASAKFF